MFPATLQAENTHMEDSGDAQTSVEVELAKREPSQGPSSCSRLRRVAAGNSEYVPESVLRNRMIQKNYLQRRKVLPSSCPALSHVNWGTQNIMPESVLRNCMIHKNYLQRCMVSACRLSHTALSRGESLP